MPIAAGTKIADDANATYKSCMRPDETLRRTARFLIFGLLPAIVSIVPSSIISLKKPLPGMGRRLRAILYLQRQ
jgi:hypothetical protein